MTEKLRVAGVTKHYGAVQALRTISLTVPSGEFLTLLGPSGSGKTTLLMILAGLIAPDAGDVWIDGTNSTWLPPYRRDIGVVFQNYALFPHLSIFENIAFPLRMRRVPLAEIKSRVNRILEVVRLSNVSERRPRELSGGQQQRIALARSAVYEPSIILMDEPLGALDKKLRDHMQLEIKRIHKDLGVTIVYVTHDQEEAMALSDRICLMNDGKIEQLGSPGELYFKPRSIFAADFLGGANFFTTTVIDRSEDHLTLQGPTGTIVKSRAGSHSFAINDAVSFVVRPEHITLIDEGEASDNFVTACLELTVMAGPLTRHYARLPNGQSMSFVQITRQQNCNLRQGESLRLGWSSEHTIVLPHADGAA